LLTPLTAFPTHIDSRTSHPPFRIPILIDLIWIRNEQPGLDVGVVGIAREPILRGQLVVGKAQALREAGLGVAVLTRNDVHPVGALHQHRSIRYPIIELGHRLPSRQIEALDGRDQITNVQIDVGGLVGRVGDQDPGLDVGVVGIAREPVLRG
jgi:hypothetical protein